MGQVVKLQEALNPASIYYPAALKALANAYFAGKQYSEAIALYLKVIKSREDLQNPKDFC